MSTLKRLIDVSHYQQISSWDSVAAAGVDGVYIKCTQGSGFVDPMCATHYKNAKAVNINAGFYHFAASEADAAQEANFFKAQIAKLGDYQLLPVLDIETNKSDLTPAQMETWIRTFIDTFGDPIMLYSYQSFLDQWLPHGHQFGQIPLWVAQYRQVASPMLPLGWTKAALWQNTNAGTVDGIVGLVDMDIPLTDDFIL